MNTIPIPASKSPVGDDPQSPSQPLDPQEEITILRRRLQEMEYRLQEKDSRVVEKLALLKPTSWQDLTIFARQRLAIGRVEGAPTPGQLMMRICGEGRYGKVWAGWESGTIPPPSPSDAAQIALLLRDDPQHWMMSAEAGLREMGKPATQIPLRKPKVTEGDIDNIEKLDRDDKFALMMAVMNGVGADGRAVGFKDLAREFKVPVEEVVRYAHFLRLALTRIEDEARVEGVKSGILVNAPALGAMGWLRAWEQRMVVGWEMARDRRGRTTVKGKDGTPEVVDAGPEPDFVAMQEFGRLGAELAMALGVLAKEFDLREVLTLLGKPAGGNGGGTNGDPGPRGQVIQMNLGAGAVGGGPQGPGSGMMIEIPSGQGGGVGMLPPTMPRVAPPPPPALTPGDQLAPSPGPGDVGQDT